MEAATPSVHRGTPTGIPKMNSVLERGEQICRGWDYVAGLGRGFVIYRAASCVSSFFHWPVSNSLRRMRTL
jgi:hypothetical protein